MITKWVDLFSKSLAGANISAQTELDALNKIAAELEQKKISADHVAALSGPGLEAVLFELGARKEIELLLRIEEMDLGKERHKLVKKTIHRLRSGGLVIPEKAGAVKVSFATPVVSEWARITPVYMMDGQQVIYYFLMSAAMGGKLLLCQTDPEIGIVTFRSLRVGESQARRAAESSALSDGKAVAVVSASPEHFFWLLGSAQERTSDLKLRQEVDSALNKLKAARPSQKPGDHPVFGLLDREEVRGRAGLGYESDRLLEHPYFAHWAFDQDTVNACSAELDQAGHSPLQLSEPQLLERMEGIFEKYARNGLDKNRVRIRSALIENAYLMALAKEIGLAEIALRVALDIEQKDHLPPFFKKVMVRSFPEAWKKLGAKKEPLIISAR
jgi:hypothetical protein